MSSYAKKVLPILRQTRRILMPHFGKAKIISQKDDSAASVVTKLDHAVEIFSSAELRRVFPDIPFVGEERGGNRQAKQFWLMDPIDGTQHFVRGLPFCTVMLALIDAGNVQFAAIYDFVNDLMYWSEKGQGAYCERKRLKVGDRPLNQAYICWETRLSTPADIATYNKLRGQAVLLKTISAGWELAMVASGKLDARICFTPFGNDYDYAAGSLLVTEAGGKVANLGLRGYDYTKTDFIAASPLVFKGLTSGQNALFPIKKSK